MFDSGLGGTTVLREIQSLLPLARYSYLLDDGFFPYGDKNDAQLLERIESLLERTLLACQPDLVVIACNTASTLALSRLRSRFAVPFVGVVPAIKPAVRASESQVVGLLATHATVNRAYTDQLHAEFGESCQLLRFACPELVTLAEDKMRQGSCSKTDLSRLVGNIQQRPGADAIDVFILGCTHFPILRSELAAHWPERVQWLDSGTAVARRVVALLEGPEGSDKRQKGLSGQPQPHQLLHTSNRLDHNVSRCMAGHGFTAPTRHIAL